MIDALRFSPFAIRSMGVLLFLLWCPGVTEGDEPSKAASGHLGEPHRAVQIGRPAPALSIEKLLQAPAGAVATWPSLEGKCVVLEFWRTWCIPCVAAIPHLNDLHGRFKDRSVVFIAVTDEPESKILSFVKRRPMSSWIGLDTDKSLFREYNVKSIPHTVLVDAKGVVAGVTNPTSATPEVIEALLAGRALNLPGEPLSHILIRPAASSGGGSVSAGRGELSITSGDPLFILSHTHDVPTYRIKVGGDLPDGLFDVIAEMPPGQEDQLHPMLQNAVESTFKIKTRREQRETEVYALTVISDQPSIIKASGMSKEGETSASTSAKRIEMTNEPFGVLVRGLGLTLRKPVIDETGLRGRYDVLLEWKAGDTESLIREVRETLGLELRPAKRPVEFLVVENE